MDISDVATSALLSTHDVYLGLIQSGQADIDVGQNTYGDIAMMIDVSCEKAVIEFLEEAKLNARMVSEEHGKFEIGTGEDYLVIIDGLDGSSAFKDSNGKARCGTMFAIYEGTKPNFEDYLFAGVLEHTTSRLVYAGKNQGVKLVDLTTNNEELREASTSTELTANTRIYIDEGIQNYSEFAGHDNYFYQPIKDNFTTKYLGSSAVYILDLAIGEAELILEYGRKDCLEHAVSYPLVVEAGGVMQFLDGTNLAKLSYDDYVQIDSGFPAVVMACTQQMADSVRKYLNN